MDGVANETARTRKIVIMKIAKLNLTSYMGSIAAVLVAISATARSADMPTLKDAYKNHFQVGAAILLPAPPGYGRRLPAATPR